MSDENSLKTFSRNFKTITKFLISHPDFHVNFSFSGEQLNYIKKKHPEYKTMLQTWTNTKQVEILGGSFYNSLLPLSHGIDRNGQIDLHSSTVRDVCGKRPRGMNLFCDAWDSSLVTNLNTCGMEYVILHENAFTSDKKRYLPVYMNEIGKHVDIVPYFESLKPTVDSDATEFVTKIVKEIKRCSAKDNFTQFNPDRIVPVKFDDGEFTSLIDNSWFELFLNSLIDYNKNGIIQIFTTTLYNYLKSSEKKIPAHICSYINCPGEQKKYESVFDYVHENKKLLALYNKILYVALLIVQFKGDKVRKQTSREKLWMAQNGRAFIESDPSSAELRHMSYGLLSEAEKLLRDSNFRESILNFDYNNDGTDDYVCRMNDYFAYINLVSGSVRELSVFKGSGNYVNNEINPVSKTNEYFRGLFIDHLFSEDKFESYRNKNTDTDGIFSKIQYKELKFTPSHHELLMQVTAKCLQGQEVQLRKKYIINSSGFTVQYVLKNLSTKPLNCVFAVESNFAYQLFGLKNDVNYCGQCVNDSEIIEIDFDKTNDIASEINAARVIDINNDISFVFEVNDNCKYSCYKLEDQENQTLVSTQYWNINLESQMETEKTINFTIVTPHKTRKKSK